MNEFGIPELKGTMSVQQETNTVVYEIIEFEDCITKQMLRSMKEQLGGGKMTLITNAGLDIHSSEMNGNTWNGIKILKYSL